MLADGVLLFAPALGYTGVMVILVVSTLLLSMVASNTVSASIFIPIALSIASSIGANPVVFAVLIAIASSIDFMLPIGTPPNAIAYSSERVTMKDMVTTGLGLNIISLLITLAFGYFLWPLVPVL